METHTRTTLTLECIHAGTYTEHTLTPSDCDRRTVLSTLLPVLILLRALATMESISDPYAFFFLLKQTDPPQHTSHHLH